MRTAENRRNNNNQSSDRIPGKLYMCTVCLEIFERENGVRVHGYSAHGGDYSVVEFNRVDAGRHHE